MINKNLIPKSKQNRFYGFGVLIVLNIFLRNENTLSHFVNIGYIIIILMIIIKKHLELKGIIRMMKTGDILSGILLSMTYFILVIRDNSMFSISGLLATFVFIFYYAIFPTKK